MQSKTPKPRGRQLFTRPLSLRTASLTRTETIVVNESQVLPGEHPADQESLEFKTPESTLPDPEQPSFQPLEERKSPVLKPKALPQASCCPTTDQSLDNARPSTTYQSRQLLPATFSITLSITEGSCGQMEAMPQDVECSRICNQCGQICNSRLQW